MAMVGMHVGTANTNGFDFDQGFIGTGNRFRFFSILQFERICID
jgi:hypothetical protein